MRANMSSIGEQIPWLPDETLYSWCSRYHRLCVNGLASATCLQLFGQRRLGVAHDFPAGIATLVARAEGSLGSVEQIIRERTLLPFYTSFRPRRLADEAMNRMAGNGIGNLKYQLGLLTSGIGAAHPLKACPLCMTVDRQKFSVAYWHRAHQLPTVWHCPEHGLALAASPLKLDQRARFQWILPEDAGLVAWQRDLACPIDAHLQLVSNRMAAFGMALTEEAPGRFASPIGLASVIRSGLARQGWLGCTGRVRWRSLDCDLQRHLEAVTRLPPLALQLDAAAARSQMSRMVSARSLAHPLRYVIWFAWLFDNWSEILQAYDASGSVRVADAVRTLSEFPPKAQPTDPRKEAATAALLSGDESMTAIACRLGVAVSTVAAWAAKIGMSTPRRPKVLTEDRWMNAAGLLWEGADKSAVARQCGVSEVRITCILRSVPGLQRQWHQVRHEKMRANARNAWLEALESSRSLGVTTARRMQPAAYAWLHRNDRSWLKEKCASISSRQVAGNYAMVKMQRADGRYARGLERALAAAAANFLGDVIRWEVLAVVAPGIKKVLKNPPAWPLTMAVLRSAMRGERNSSSEPLI